MAAVVDARKFFLNYPKLSLFQKISYSDTEAGLNRESYLFLGICYYTKWEVRSV